jgi:hypothetical protein
VRVTGYAYPWDVLEATGFLERVSELELSEVAVALAYHSTRAATPWSPERTAVLARHAALYRPVRHDLWRDLRLRPAEPDWTGTVDSGGDAVRAVNAAGVPAAAWLVLTHSSHVGDAVPEVAVRNCFGEPYPWALCPSRPEVRDYAATLTAEALAGLDVSSVILEACGQLGVVHQCRHEKTDAVWSPAVARLLSMCCCPACAALWKQSGVDGAEVRQRLRAEVRSLLESGELGETGDRLPRAMREVLLSVRQWSTDALRRRVLEVLPAGVRVVLHGALDPWVTGALPGLTPAAPDEVDAVVLQCWQPGADSLDAVRQARARLPSTVDIGAYVTTVGANPVPDPDAYVTDLAKAGAGELHLYHLGLAGRGRYPDLLAAAHAGRL